MKFSGFPSGKHADLGMPGSLLYHMAMVTKMETETRFLLEELRVDKIDITEQLTRFYGDFSSDMHELTKPIVTLGIDLQLAANACLSTDEKIQVFTKLNEKTRTERPVVCLST